MLITIRDILSTPALLVGVVVLFGFCKNGIEFEHGKTARIIFCLAVKDQQKHMGILRDIRKSMARKKQVDELIELGDSKKVCEILRSDLSDNE